MKSVRFCILTGLIVTLGTAGAVSAVCSVGLNDSLGPSGVYYNVGDTICYTISLAVDEGDCVLTDVNVWFFDPCNPPSDGACSNPSAGVLIAQGLTLTPGGDPCVFDCNTHPALAHVVTLDNLTDGDGDQIRAYIATEFIGQVNGQLPDCDPKSSLNWVLPPEPNTDVSIGADQSTIIIGEGGGPDY